MDKIIIKGESYSGKMYQYDIVEKICIAIKHLQKDFNDKRLEYIKKNAPEIFSQNLGLEDNFDLFDIAYQVLTDLENEKILEFKEKDLINQDDKFEYVVVNGLIINLAVFEKSSEFYDFVNKLFPENDWEIDVFENIPTYNNDDFVNNRDSYRLTDLLFEYVHLKQEEKEIINTLVDNGYSYDTEYNLIDNYLLHKDYVIQIIE